MSQFPKRFEEERREVRILPHPNGGEITEVVTKYKRTICIDSRTGEEVDTGEAIMTSRKLPGGSSDFSFCCWVPRDLSIEEMLGL